MANRNIKDGVRIRRAVYIPYALASRIDGLVGRGATASGVISVALQRSLATIEKQIESGKGIPGLRIRKEK